MSLAKIQEACTKAAGRSVIVTLVEERRGQGDPNADPPESGLVKAAHVRIIDGTVTHEIDLIGPDGKRTDDALTRLAVSCVRPPPHKAP